MKKLFLKRTLAVTCLFTMLILACGIQKKNGTVTVFAGASMTGPLSEIARSFTSQTGIAVLYDFQGTGQLGSKILAGQKPDIFIPASQEWADILINKGLIDHYEILAHNIPVLITKNGCGIRAIADLKNKKYRVALADPQAATIGKTTEKILTDNGMTVSDFNVVARGFNVKQLLQWTLEGEVDASFAWKTDALEQEKIKAITVPDFMKYKTDIPLCIFADGNASDKVIRFVEFLKNEGRQVFRKYGFTILNKVDHNHESGKKLEK